MLYPPVADLLKNVESRYLLVNVVAQRARQIAAEAEALGESLPEKPIIVKQGKSGLLSQFFGGDLRLQMCLDVVKAFLNDGPVAHAAPSFPVRL